MKKNALHITQRAIDNSCWRKGLEVYMDNIVIHSKCEKKNMTWLVNLKYLAVA